ncbi:hypothetical protein BJV82DRAFT_622794 [Fennellomyces sp. T-0311]|nr:hypothetical protein BJV82DRAFT_622794 [Fennellomyces sp. T-0311]
MATNTQRDLLEHKLKTLLQDALLADVPPSPTAEDVDTLIAIEQGRAYRITVDRSPLDALSIVVGQGSSVHDIKRMIQNTIDRGSTTKISWYRFRIAICTLHA